MAPPDTLSDDEASQSISKEVAFYSTIPIAQSTLADTSFTPYYRSRTVTHSGRGHTLMGATWNTAQTIPHLLFLTRQPTASLPGEMRRFYTFGDGLNAHPNLLHGGVLSCILDSTMSNAAGLAIRDMDTGLYGSGGKDGSIFTAQLNVSYRKPVTTPGTVMVRAWVTRVEDGRRKIWVEAVMDGGERGEVRHATAEGLWIIGKSKEVNL